MVRLINYLVYSNILIAACAVSMAMQTRLIFGLPHDPYLYGLVFFSTMLIYAMHRIGFSTDFLTPNKRFMYLRDIRIHLLIYSLISIVMCLWLYEYVLSEMNSLILLSGILSVSYVFPCIPSSKGFIRLRDVHYIKIYLVAFVWTVVTVCIPLIHDVSFSDQRYVFHLLDRSLFIFAITLPFDIRDYQQEDRANVKTMVSLLGIQKAKWLSIFCMIIWVILAFVQFEPGLWVLGYTITAIIVILIVLTANEKKEDYHYSLFLDGTMLINLPFFCIEL